MTHIIIPTNREGIDWADIDWVDNAECLDLVERVQLNFVVYTQLLIIYNTQKLGILDLLNEESRFPKGTDRSLLDKLHNAHKVSTVCL